jgi:hypothetical protein
MAWDASSLSALLGVSMAAAVGAGLQAQVIISVSSASRVLRTGSASCC